MLGRVRPAWRLPLAALATSALLGGATAWYASGRGREGVGDALMLVGLVTIALGTLGLLGGYRGRGETVGLAASAGHASLAERTQIAVADIVAAYRATVFLTLVGLPLVLAAFLVDPRI